MTSLVPPIISADSAICSHRETSADGTIVGSLGPFRRMTNATGALWRTVDRVLNTDVSYL